MRRRQDWAFDRRPARRTPSGLAGTFYKSQRVIWFSENHRLTLRQARTPRQLAISCHRRAKQAEQTFQSTAVEGHNHAALGAAAATGIDQ